MGFYLDGMTEEEMRREIRDYKIRIKTLEHNISLMKCQHKAHNKRIKEIKLAIKTQTLDSTSGGKE